MSSFSLSSWTKVCPSSSLGSEERLHFEVESRYITIFRHRGVLSAIDSVCHHAGGPLTNGPLQEIEELGLTVVSCPWHRFLISIDGVGSDLGETKMPPALGGIKVYKGIDIINGKPTESGWKTGKVVQRPHQVTEGEDGYIYVNINKEGVCVSDQDSTNPLCGKQFELTPLS